MAHASMVRREGGADMGRSGKRGVTRQLHIAFKSKFVFTGGTQCQGGRSV